ncbi:MAG: cation-translocating P-type ATPase [Promethearchaeota archaeon]|nr:MAG: cation-translocating P-type ATPase [Candidatus Lokiarchaeota archaeon]
MTNQALTSQILAFISLIFSGFGVFRETIEDLVHKKITANLLMAIAAIASFFILHGQEGATAILLYSIAEYVEELTTERSRRAIKDLLELTPDEALLKVNEEYITVRSKSINIGDIIGVKSGMKVPLDGIIIKGATYLNESAITGESIPVFKEIGDEVYASSLNEDNFVDIQVTREYNNTIIAQIAEMINQARKNKSQHEKFIERFAKYYTPLILISSILIMLIPTLFFNLNFNTWFYRGLILLVVSCPCALTLSTPLANISALTKLAREGIMVKGNKYLELADKIQLVSFDKTGTLTEGKLKVFDIINYDISKEKILQIMASLESLSEHPIANTIVKHTKERDIPLLSVENFKVIKGMGVEGVIDNTLYHIGSQKYLENLDYEISQENLGSLGIQGIIPVFLGSKKKVLGILTIRDVLRVSAPILIDGLKKTGKETILLSGDHQEVCETIGACLDIDSIHGELLPNQKLDIIRLNKEKGKKIAMVGDGINDAPALALADLGIAIGASATDLTLETADVIIMNDDLKKILTFFDISKKTNKIIKQNIWSSILIKVSFAILTVIGLMTLWLAVGIGDMGVSLAILLNGMRIFRYKVKYKDLSTDIVESEANSIICRTCNTKNVLPQHHGRDMVKSKKKLVCWRRLLNNDELEPCEEELPLLCPQCNNELEVI